MKKGKLITLYGINNIGKSTQAKYLVDNLRKNGYDTVLVKYPVYDLEPSGIYLNNTLRAHHGRQDITEEELQMWFTINRYQFEPTLKSWLDEGKIVVAEDYTGTGLAWGSAKGAKLDWLTSLNKFLIKEDFAILLKGRRNLHAKEEKHIHENNDDLIEACQFILENLADSLKWTKLLVKPSITETAKDIWELVDKFLKGKDGK
jgi:dTMP kinase